ncbi:hypothetical protein EVA_08375 [gut metagenome]|uniref:Uncharacterized protein n=1 Tax=gut metagenome TaxID=749906 RepID=J9GT90_9ZZZZ
MTFCENKIVNTEPLYSYMGERHFFQSRNLIQKTDLHFPLFVLK